MELPNEALESYGFNIDYLCADARYIEEGKLSNVFI